MATSKTTRKKSVKPASKPKTVAGKKRLSLSSFQKKLFVSISIILLAAGIFAGYSVWQNTQTDAATCVSRTFKVGSKNTCVKYAQQIINAAIALDKTAAKSTDTANIGSLKPVSTNGSFTSATKTTVTGLQVKKTVAATGKIDPTTWGVLCELGLTAAPDAYKYAGCGVSTVKYEKVATVNDCGTMQGGTSDGTSLYFACVDAGGKTMRIVKYTAAGKKIGESEKFTRKDTAKGSDDSLGHANDMTYNKRLNVLVITAWDNNKKGSSGVIDEVRFVDPSSLKLTGSAALSDGQSVSNICYNDSTDQYVSNGRLYDNNFQYIKTVYDVKKVDKDITISGEKSILRQGITCDSSYIYVLRVVYKQSGFNMVGVYDWNGKNIGAYKVNLNDEGENLSIIDGVMYVGINEGSMSSGGDYHNDYFIKLKTAPLGQQAETASTD